MSSEFGDILYSTSMVANTSLDYCQYLPVRGLILCHAWSSAFTTSSGRGLFSKSFIFWSMCFVLFASMSIASEYSFPKSEWWVIHRKATSAMVMPCFSATGFTMSKALKYASFQYLALYIFPCHLSGSKREPFFTTCSFCICPTKKSSSSCTHRSSYHSFEDRRTVRARLTDEWSCRCPGIRMAWPSHWLCIFHISARPLIPCSLIMRISRKGLLCEGCLLSEG